MTYNIKISDPRVRRRVSAALAYVTAYANPVVPKSLSTREIDKHLGQQQLPLSKALRKLLLTVYDSHWNMATGKTKQYLLNLDGAQYLHNQLNPGTDYSASLGDYISAYVKQFERELLTGDFQYRHKSHRYWHPLQNMPSEHRRRELSKYRYDHIYDIRCAQPSILLHLARQTGIKPQHTMAVEYYIQHRTQIRQMLADDLQIDLDKAKKLISMLFNGAPIGFNDTYVTSQMVDFSHSKINALKQNTLICALRPNLTRIWNRLSQYKLDGEYLMPRQYDINGRKKRINSRDKALVYFTHEHIVMTAVCRYLKSQNARFFTEHDGWSSNIRIDLPELTEYVRQQTGIQTIEFEYEFYKGSSSAKAPDEQVSSAYHSVNTP